MQDVIKINQEDNVAVALRPIAKGEDTGYCRNTGHYIRRDSTGSQGCH